MTSENAWETFKESRQFKKAVSVQGQLDTMASQLNDIQTDTKRIADVIGQIQGDNAAIDYANEEAPVAPEPQAMPTDGVPVPKGVPDAMPEGESGGGAAPFADASATGIGSTEAGDVPSVPSAEEPVPNGGMESSVPSAGPAGEGFSAPSVPVPDPVELDLIAKVKYMIANSDDPSQLRGLADLLVTALSQSRPASPMEPAPIERSHSMADVMKSADAPNVPDVPDVMTGKSEDVAKADDGIATSKDSENALEAVTDKTEDAPKGLDELTKSDADTVTIVETVESDVPPEVAETVGKVVDAVEEAVTDVLTEDCERDRTEGDGADADDDFTDCSVKKSVLPSLRDMMMHRDTPIQGDMMAGARVDTKKSAEDTVKSVPMQPPVSRERMLADEMARLMAQFTPEEIRDAMGMLMPSPAQSDTAPNGAVGSDPMYKDDGDYDPERAPEAEKMDDAKDDAEEDVKEDAKDDAKRDMRKSGVTIPSIRDMANFKKSDRPSNAVMTNSGPVMPMEKPNSSGLRSIRDMMAE